MRNVYSILLATVLMLNTIAGISILCFHHYRIDFMIESIIRNESYSGNLHQLEFNTQESDDLIWFKDGREFMHHGKMYDVVSTEVTEDGRTIYHCIKDEKENEIYNTLATNISHSSSGPSQDDNLILQFFRILSNPVIVPSSLIFNGHIVSQKIAFSYSEASHPVYLAIACEPPDGL